MRKLTEIRLLAEKSAPGIVEPENILIYIYLSMEKLIKFLIPSQSLFIDRNYDHLYKRYILNGFSVLFMNV